MTISKQVFAAAVANGLDPRLVATWHTGRGRHLGGLRDALAGC